MNKKSTARQAADIIFSCNAEEFGNLSVDTLARRLGVTDQQLSSSFKSEFDFYINDFIDNNIAYRASVLLTTRKDLSVKDISELFKCENESSFSNIFWNYFGITPGKFRETSLRKSPVRKPA